MPAIEGSPVVAVKRQPSIDNSLQPFTPSATITQVCHKHAVLYVCNVVNTHTQIKCFIFVHRMFYKQSKQDLYFFQYISLLLNVSLKQ